MAKQKTKAPAAKVKAAKEKTELPATVTLVERLEVQKDAHAFVVLPEGTKLKLNDDSTTYGNSDYGDLFIPADRITE